MDKRSLLFIVLMSLSFVAIHTWFDPAPKPKIAQTERAVTTPSKEEPLLVSNSEPVALTPADTNEKFYVLENDYQQLVFSTKGGALAEINLPLKSDTHPHSIVKEIDIDRQILKDSPPNAHFPLHPYTAVDGFHEEGSLGGYYPLLRRSILGSDGTVKHAASPEYYALNIIGDDPEISQISYRVKRFESNLIQFEGSGNGRRITKTYTIPQEQNGPYCFLLDIQVDGDTKGLWLSSGIPDVEIVSDSYIPLLRYQVTHKGSNDVNTIDLPKKGSDQVTSTRPNWISNNNGFLGLILDPLAETKEGYQALKVDGNLLPTRLSVIDARHHLYAPADYPGYATALPLKSNTTIPFRIFAGPFDDSLLKTLDNLYENPVKHYSPEYSSAQSIQGWFSFISEPFAKFLFFLMQIFYAVTRSWAAAIILLTIALKAMMYPLNAWSIRSMAKMQQLGPKVQAIQAKYKGDPKRAQMETIALYRESGANPITGCLPMLLQMPFLIGMFYLLKSSFPLRGAMFIPGWIDNLAAPDVLFTWGQPLWFIGNEFHLLPILTGLTMYLQQKRNSPLPKDPKLLTDTQKQQKTTGIIISIFLTVMFYNFPSGLNLYFVFSTLLGVFQQEWMAKKTKTQVAKKL